MSSNDNKSNDNFRTGVSLINSTCRCRSLLRWEFLNNLAEREHPNSKEIAVDIISSIEGWSAHIIAHLMCLYNDRSIDFERFCEYSAIVEKSGNVDNLRETITSSDNNYAIELRKLFEEW